MSEDSARPSVTILRSDGSPLPTSSSSGGNATSSSSHGNPPPRPPATYANASTSGASGSSTIGLEGLNDDEQLPPKWERRFTESGRPYYLDHLTKTTTWVRPAPLPPGHFVDFSPSLSASWERRLDPNNRVYYVDHNTRTTTWQHPSPTLLNTMAQWQQMSAARSGMLQQQINERTHCDDWGTELPITEFVGIAEFDTQARGSQITQLTVGQTAWSTAPLHGTVISNALLVR
ncbi:unnamed protein product [Echinostoma caproni]|uniref:WW domain-containing protein n=1 Tax=Echinostoma caproni TaxID=27848 RepID=A0A183AZW6_9TREM|nr:unnamed protein product [Echinostoma caproni]